MGEHMGDMKIAYQKLPGQDSRPVSAGKEGVSDP